MVRTIILVAALSLSACTPGYKDQSASWVLPAGMKDCKVYYLESGLSSATVVRCPDSETTTVSGGKSKKSVTIN